jgi:anti-sigma regulatory factor (Ser/Thr protein kinase)
MAEKVGAVRHAKARVRTTYSDVLQADAYSGVLPADADAATLARRAETASVVSASYAGRPASVPAASRFVRERFAASPRLDDLELIVGEFATNAIKHTPSGERGGTFTITMLCWPDGVRIEVTDLGSTSVRPRPCADALSEYGRGLMIVSALADKAGDDITADQGHCAWAELSWLIRPVN